MQGIPGEVYNIGTQKERTVMDVAHDIAKIFKLPTEKITHVRDRAFNDRRYYICDDKLLRLGALPQPRAAPALVPSPVSIAQHALRLHAGSLALPALLVLRPARRPAPLNMLSRPPQVLQSVQHVLMRCCAGWKESTSWEAGLKKTVEWYLAHGFNNYWDTGDVEQALAPHPIMHSKQNADLS